MSYKSDFTKFLLDAGALRFGDFTLKSGRKSPYFINTGAFDTGAKMDRLGGYYAACIMDYIGEGLIPEDIGTVFGPAYKGIPLAVATASALAREYNVDTGYTFNRKEAKDHGEGGSFVGRPVNDGDRIVIVDDVITAGTAVREIVPVLRAAAKVEISGLIISVDRMEKGPGGELTAVREAERELGIRVLSIITVKEILKEASDIKDASGAPYINAGLKKRMEDYMAEYCK
ncbi:MAG: orotate phosphoribosyltransferase [Clostridiales Family XIII bacterium]|jgi:orotate phosphoribosyltransferase|nr:orotate phosphoribosyltransferase [Clostridiales Family XIII bacterium]